MPTILSWSGISASDSERRHRLLTGHLIDNQVSCFISIDVDVNVYIIAVFLVLGEIWFRNELDLA